MAENKLTPEEVKKALECCVGESPNCNDCPANRYEAGKCFDLVKIQASTTIDSQQTAIEKMQRLVDQTDTNCRIAINLIGGYERQLKQARTEAIKEFAERLKERAKANEWNGTICGLDIDNLLNEMVGDDDAEK